MTTTSTATRLSIAAIIAGSLGFVGIITIGIGGCGSDVHAQPAATVATDPTSTTDMEASTGLAEARAESRIEARDADVSDQRIVREIKQAIRDDRNISATGRLCQVSCESGEVTLAGFVSSEQERDLIEAHALQVKGVNKVVSTLEVKPRPQ